METMLSCPNILLEYRSAPAVIASVAAECRLLWSVVKSFSIPAFFLDAPHVFHHVVGLLHQRKDSPILPVGRTGRQQ